MGLTMPEIKPGAQITLLFALILFLMSVVLYQELNSGTYLVLLYLSLMVLQVLFLKIRNKGVFTKYLSDFIFPIVAVIAIFDSLGELVHSLNSRDIDNLLIKADHLLTGGYPTVFLEKFIHPFFTETLQISYTSYYFLPVILGITLKVKGMDRELHRSIFIILLCFFLSYVGYMIFPAIGPRYTILHLHEQPLTGLFVAEHIYDLLNMLEGIKRDAFPSGHTAIALTVLALSFRYTKRLFYIFIPFVIGLIISTVYLRYHYVIDILGGILLVVLSLGIGDKYYGWWEKRYDPHYRG